MMKDRMYVFFCPDLSSGRSRDYGQDNPPRGLHDYSGIHTMFIGLIEPAYSSGPA